MEAISVDTKTVTPSSPNKTPQFITGYYLDPLDKNPNSRYAIIAVVQLDTSYFEEITIGELVGVKTSDETKRAIVLDFDSKRSPLKKRFANVVQKFQAEGKPEIYHKQYDGYEECMQMLEAEAYQKKKIQYEELRAEIAAMGLVGMAQKAQRARIENVVNVDLSVKSHKGTKRKAALSAANPNIEAKKINK